MKETMEQSGMYYIGKCNDGSGYHLLQDKETGKLELWACKKNHAGYGIKFRNTHLEFVRSVTEEDYQFIKDSDNYYTGRA